MDSRDPVLWGPVRMADWLVAVAAEAPPAPLADPAAAAAAAATALRERPAALGWAPLPEGFVLDGAALVQGLTGQQVRRSPSFRHCTAPQSH